MFGGAAGFEVDSLRYDLGTPADTVKLRAAADTGDAGLSASPARSSLSARWLAICAALEQPEHEYTSGNDLLISRPRFRTRHLARQPAPHGLYFPSLRETGLTSSVHHSSAIL